jgi:hypothetical protein
MKRLPSPELTFEEDSYLTQNSESAIALPSILPEAAQSQLVRMFRDPHVLEKDERAELVAQLKAAADMFPHLAEVRVLLGMALCVDYHPQAALEELRTSVLLAPDSFLAHLKLGELLMRLRICDQAEEQTHLAARLATNPLQSELARRQAGSIRIMRRQGIERGGYRGIVPRIAQLLRRSRYKNRAQRVGLNSR